MRNAEWAIITTRITPKYSVSPAASRAYRPPSSSPRMMLWRRRGPDTSASPGRLDGDEVGLGQLLRQYDPDLAVDVLLDHVSALRPALGVPAQRPDHGVDGRVAQVVDQLLLTLWRGVGAVRGLDRSGHHLAGGP